MAKHASKVTNCYSVLGISKNSTPQKIQKAFWDLARRYHPDLNRSPLAEERYKQIVSAYQILKSPERRNRLDARILASSCQHLAGNIFSENLAEDENSRGFLPILMDLLTTENITQTQDIYSLAYPHGVRYRQLLFVGPPGAGKSLIVHHMHAWPEEGNLDLSLPNWWLSPTLAVRPREVHLLFPFRGHKEGMTVFDPPIIHGTEACCIDISRIVVPPPKKWIFATNWQKRYVFDFLLPEPEQVFAWRQERAHRKTHPGDIGLTLKTVERQYVYFERIARYLHLQGIEVIVRKGWDQPPLRYILPEEEDRLVCEAVWSRLVER